METEMPEKPVGELTDRELFSALILQGIVMRDGVAPNVDTDAQVAVSCADALIRVLRAK
jgi:hypothetical protein